MERLSKRSVGNASEKALSVFEPGSKVIREINCVLKWISVCTSPAAQTVQSSNKVEEMSVCLVGDDVMNIA